MNVLRAGAALGFVSALLSACAGGEAASASSQAGGETGSLDDLTVADLSDAQIETLRGNQAALRVLMTDAPVDAEHVNVTVCKVQVHAGADDSAEASDEVGADAGAARSAEPTEGDAGNSSASGWRTVAEGCRSFDLLALRDGITTELGLDTLPPGSYGQIRLNVSEASIVVNGQEHPLTIPSAAQRGIQIGHRFELVAGELTTLALDFDAARSIHESAGAGYILRPVITPVGERRESFADAARQYSDAGHSHPAQEDHIQPDAGAPSDVGAARAVHPEPGKPDGAPHAH